MSDAFARLAGMAGGYVEARILQAAVRLGVFDALRDEETADAPTVAAAIGAEARATGLLLDALAVVGLVDKDGPRYRLNDLSRTYLLSASPKDFSGMIRFDALMWEAWGKLEDAVRTGRPARLPDMYQTDKAETGIFIEAMDSLVNARGDAEVTADALDLGGERALLDIGPGPATYPIALCRRNPALRATLYDLPGTLRITERYVRASDVAARIECIPGDYRTDAIPGGYDVVFLSNIIHSENEATNEALIAKLSKSTGFGRPPHHQGSHSGRDPGGDRRGHRLQSPDAADDRRRALLHAGRDPRLVRTRRAGGDGSSRTASAAYVIPGHRA